MRTLVNGLVDQTARALQQGGYRHSPNAVAGLIRSLSYHRRKLGRRSQRYRQATTELGYFRNNGDKMEYARYHASGLIIFSGPVEAAAKTIVGHRLKRSGMQLDPPGRSADPQPTSPGTIETLGCFLELVPAADHAHNNLEKGSVNTRLHP